MLLLQQLQVRKLTAKLRRLNDEQRTEYLTTVVPSKANHDLVLEINRFIEHKNQTLQQYRIKDLAYQQAISNISHDMRTPLTAILGYIRLLDNTELSEAERQAYLSIVQERARSLQRLILDFYDLSRLDEGEYQFVLIPMDINKLCLELLAQVYDDFEMAGIMINTDLLPTATKVIADESAVIRVVNNILQNVKRYGHESLDITSRIENDSLVLSFSNRSEPLSSTELSRVFERSFVASSSREDGSTGLGLSICKALLMQMGHSISATYHEGVFITTIYWKMESEE